jgi:hypothetical protein
MTTKIDVGHKVLTSLARTYGQLQLADKNEAETRLKVIDEVLFEVLGWLKEDVSVEERVAEDGKTKFADYIIRTASTAILIEAKRASWARRSGKRATTADRRAFRSPPSRTVLLGSCSRRSASIKSASTTPRRTSSATSTTSRKGSSSSGSCSPARERSKAISKTNSSAGPPA